MRISGNITQSRQYIPKCADMSADASFPDGIRPTCNHRYTYSALTQTAFSPSGSRFERSRTIEPDRIYTSIESRTVVTAEYNQRVVIQSKFFQQFYKLTYLFIKIAYHRRIGSVRIPAREITFVSQVRRLVAKFFDIIVNPFLRSL